MRRHYYYCATSHEASLPGEAECRACPGVALEHGRCACCGATWSRDVRGRFWTLEDTGQLVGSWLDISA
jgi:hypothetical protein